ncbi:MAG: carbohydrate binding family 9 domain-containing protein, partial [Bacteroidales bacterium]|nr:carbohydrate binding family 9 domain-containing protein [Bacteroidales bacterium]
MRPTLLVCLVCFFACTQTLIGQTTPINRGSFRLHAKKTEQPIVVDGMLDEAIWSQAEKTTPFFKILPIDTGFAHSQSEVMVANDETNIYIGIICHDTMPGKRPAESLRRDFSFGKNDNFIAFIDTYNDQTNGFAFGISAAGAQWDGSQANGGLVANDWDGKWYSAVQNYPSYWVAEFSIPFRTIRYREGVSEWGINFSRLDLKTNEKTSWAPVPRQFQSANLAYTGTLAWEEPPPPSGIRFSLIPYVSGKATHQTEAGDPVDFGGGAGLDAKVILSTSMNLDVTVNPDYSQVEVDRQQLNLDRFELYFPEKRKFFLENSDLFASLGAENLRPFFSRRIGLNAPVLAGARLSGNAGENWRVGLMNMQTGVRDLNSANNYSVVVLQRKVLSRSNVGVFMTNKQVVATPDDTAYNAYSFNRVAGAEFNFASADNNWTGKTFYHQSFSPGPEGNRYTTAAMIKYETQQFSAGWNQAYVGGNYLAEIGFVRRRGYHQTNPIIGYKFYPMSDRIANHGPQVTVDLFF